MKNDDGMDSVDGTGSWLQIVCFGPDKLEGVPGYKNRVDVAEGTIGYHVIKKMDRNNKWVEHSVKIPCSNENNKGGDDNYALTVVYTPQGIQVRTDGFDTNIKIST